MKILEVIHRYPEALGGSEKVAEELSRQFKAQGHDVTVITSTSMDNSDTRGFSTSRSFTLRSRNKRDYKEVKDGIKIYRFRPSFQFWPFAFNPSMKHWLKKNSDNYDIIHVHGYQTYEAMTLSRLKTKTPYVLTAHDIVAHYGGLLDFIKKIFDIIFGRKILKKAKALIALTPENVKQYKEICDCAKKIRLIPNGIEKKTSKVNKKTLKKKLGEPENIILYVGRIVKYKGCQDIIRALPEILDNKPETKAVFVGPDQGYTKELKSLAKELKVENRCIFTGKVKDPFDFYQVADAFVLPSRGEGFGLVAIEAMNQGVPAVLADLGGLKYVLKEVGGRPIDMDKDPSRQIAKHVTEILENKTREKKNMKKIIEKTRYYTWDNISKKTLDVFERIRKR